MYPTATITDELAQGCLLPMNLPHRILKEPARQNPRCPYVDGGRRKHDSRLSINVKGSGMDKYPSKAHAQRVADKLTKLQKGLIVLQGEKAAKYSNSDMPRPFRQDRYFYYLTGCNEPGCWVTYDLTKDKLTLWLPAIDLRRVFYDGRGSTIEEAMELYDVDEARYIEGKKHETNLRDYLLRHHEDGGDFTFFEMPGSLIERKMRPLLKERRKLGLRGALQACRAVKDEHEIALIKEANAITTEAHTNVLKALRKCTREQEAEAVYTATCIAHGAREQAYPPIVGAGSNASQLHYVDNSTKFGDSQLLLIDAGAEYQRYASDVTRTMPLNAAKPGYWPSTEAEKLYNKVEAIQESCIKLLRPGKKFIEVHWHSVHLAIDALLDLGVLKGEHMEIFRAGTVLAFYPHGLGHHVGLEVHDVQPPIIQGTNKKKDHRFRKLRLAYKDYASSSDFNAAHKGPGRSDHPKNPQAYSLDPSRCLAPTSPSDPPLEAGNVVTIEPGLYFNKFILETYFLHDQKHNQFIDEEVLEKYLAVGGVRIEDDILITRGGYENLTTALKGEEMLEVIRKGSDAK